MAMVPGVWLPERRAWARQTDSVATAVVAVAMWPLKMAPAGVSVRPVLRWPQKKSMRCKAEFRSARFDAPPRPLKLIYGGAAGLLSLPMSMEPLAASALAA